MTLCKAVLSVSLSAMITAFSTGALAQAMPAPLGAPAAATPPATTPATPAAPPAATPAAPAAPAASNDAANALASPAPAVSGSTAAMPATAPRDNRAPAISRYTYINNESEYSFDLPEAPSAVTIWGDQKEPIPYLEKPARFGMVGETANYRRVNEANGEYINIQITFLKADRDFLLTRTPENMQETLENEVRGLLLENKQFKYAPGKGTVKKMNLTGFSIDKGNNPLFNSVFYLTGDATMMIIKVQYSIENQIYNSQYQQMLESIKFIGK